MARVTFENVTKTFRTKRGEVRAVDHLNLDVKDGELVVLVGPSGCGKTTTLRLLAGLEDLTAGTIRIAGRVVNDVAPKDRNIAMVFQNYALYPHMTVFDNMAFGLKMRRVPKADIRRKVNDVAHLLGLESLLDRKPAALSGGERQRVALGRAIVRKPQVFLFDEPLSNLDAGLRIQMRTQIKRLHRDLGTTTIYVTHDQEEAMTLGDRIVVLDNGVVQQCGAPLEVYDRPANRFVAGFIGTPPMNFVEGRLENRGPTVRFSGGAVRTEWPAALAERVRPHCNRNVVLGIRPEHVRLDGVKEKASRGGPSGAGGVYTEAGQMSVLVVEPLGDSVNVHLMASTGEVIVARMSPAIEVTSGQHVTLRLDLARAHLFAADNRGQRLA